MKYICIYNASGILEAELTHLFLEAAGIRCFVAQESAGIAMGFTIGPMGNAKIYVDEDQAGEAVDLINKMESGQLIINDEETDNSTESI